MKSVFLFIKKVYRLLRERKNRLQLLMYRQLSLLFPVKDDIITFNNFNGKGYGDNPKYIAEEILKQKLSYRIFWLVGGKADGKFLPQRIEPVRIRSFKGMRVLAGSKVIVNNVKNPLPFIKKKGQYYIQTWHGSFGLKYIENDAKEHLSSYYIKHSQKDSLVTDLMISSSNLQTEEFRTAFWYNGEVLESGMPRNDFYFRINESAKLAIKHGLGIPPHKKVLLYCPTFRDNGSTDAYDINWNNIIKALDSRNDGEWIVLIRLHPNVPHPEQLFHFTERIVDVSFYPDMQKLMAISDLQITDYSSTLYDSIILQTPVFLYAPDITEYQQTRGLKPFYFDLPFTRATTDEELRKAVLRFDLKEFLREKDTFSRMYQCFDNGHASERIVERIHDVMTGSFPRNKYGK